MANENKKPLQIGNGQQDEELATVKKVGEVETISREEMEFRMRELAKCKNDIVYFANKYFKIISLSKGLCTIKTYKRQEELLRTMQHKRRVIVLASRQAGKCFLGSCIIYIRNKKFQWLKFPIPVGLFHLLAKIGLFK